MDYGVEALSVPVLLFHGSDDTRVPVWLSDRLAEARPDIVQYVAFDGAHTRGILESGPSGTSTPCAAS